MHYPSTTNHYDHGGHIMITDYDSTDLDTDDFDIEDFDIDYHELAEMAEEYGYGALAVDRGDHYDIDADNPNY